MGGFTHHSGISLSNLISSNGTLGTATVTTLTGTTIKGTKASYPTVHATTKVSSPTINATTNFNLKSLIVKGSKGASTYSALSDGNAFVPATGDTIIRALQWKYSDAVLKSCSQITATTKIRATGVLSFSSLLSGSVVLVDILDKT